MTTIRRAMKLLTSREFNRDVSLAKREAAVEPVLITDRGQPTHVLMSICRVPPAHRRGREHRRPAGQCRPTRTGRPRRLRRRLGPPGAAALMYLLDTGIVLELRKARAPGADQGLAAWAAGIARQRLFLSALSLLEIETAAARLARKDKSAGLAVRDWIDNQVTPAFEGRVLAVDARVVRRRAQLPYANTRDGLLAATALEHGLTLSPTASRPSAPGASSCSTLWLRPRRRVMKTETGAKAPRPATLWLKNLYVRA